MSRSGQRTRRVGATGLAGLVATFLVAGAGAAAPPVGAAAAQCLGQPATIVGTAGADDITGTAHADVISAGPGVDTIAGLGGNDRICGGGGKDVVSGGGGNDRISGGERNDVLSGDGGNDRVFGGNGNDKVSGGSGDDVVGGDAGNDRLRGNAGFDVLNGGEGDDSLNGGTEEDVADFTNATSVVANLATGVATGAGTDTMNEVEDLSGSAGNDTLTGDDGVNVLEGAEGVDALDGGGANDFASYILAQGGVTVDLVAGTATGEGADTLTGFEGIIGSFFDDNLTTGATNDIVLGLDGSDTIHTGDGVDQIEAGPGNDSVDGGASLDVLTFFLTSNGISVNLGTGVGSGEGADTYAGIENVVGSFFDDTIVGDAGLNILRGGPGNDFLDGGGGLGDQLIGDEGADTCINGGTSFDASCEVTSLGGPVAAARSAQSAAGSAPITPARIAALRARIAAAPFHR